MFCPYSPWLPFPSPQSLGDIPWPTYDNESLQRRGGAKAASRSLAFHQLRQEGCDPDHGYRHGWKTGWISNTKELGAIPVGSHHSHVPTLHALTFWSWGIVGLVTSEVGRPQPITDEQNHSNPGSRIVLYLIPQLTQSWYDY